ncbi:hypothetical protein LR48_Vigan11g173400 [Vigna angularis]|uniref:RNase III domain-containing protein n=1 Tax=Phaseolus angularis TaxID=3914 RepID=A0A0L9VUD5_PHAAN|nr:hypothetical protein LR48_Vigan11g173400 [Vigna angularis]
MEASVIEVERILSYGFIDRKLLEEALTHSSSTGVSYERLEFVGDHIIGLAISKHLFLAYPQLDPGQLSDLLDANVSKEKLARVVIHRGLHRFICQSFSSMLRDEIEQFEKVVTLEKYLVGIHGGSVGGPKVLSDIVESVAAAVYFDLGFDLEKFWEKVVGEGASCPTKKWQQQLVGGGSFHFEVLQPPGNIIIIFLMDTALRNGRGRLSVKNVWNVYCDVIYVKEHDPWCKRYMELYNELRENWERLYWDEGYSKKLAQDHANYESAEDDDRDFSPYRSRRPQPQMDYKDQTFGRNRQPDNLEKVSVLRDKFEYDRERRMREKAFGPMHGGSVPDSHDSNRWNQPLDTDRYFSQTERR